MKNDVKMQQDVVAELAHEPNVVAGTIGVEVHHGVVKLAGRLSDDATKKIVELAARRVEGVTTVITDIDIPGQGAAQRSPGDISRAPGGV